MFHPYEERIWVKRVLPKRVDVEVATSPLVSFFANKVCLTVEIYFTACKRCKRQIRPDSASIRLLSQMRVRCDRSSSVFFRHVLEACRTDTGQRYIVKSADTLNHPRHGPQHLAMKSIPIHFNKTTQTVSKLTTVLLTWRTGRANGKELFGVVPCVTIERGVWGGDSGQADVRSCRWKFAR